jgi:hypothetical protein
MAITRPYAERPVMLTLLPLMAAVMAGLLVIGVALQVLPLYLHDDLGQQLTAFPTPPEPSK